MTKEKMIAELEELLTVLETPADEYAGIISKNSAIEFEEKDTYPYRLGVAKATIKYILTGKP